MRGEHDWRRQRLGAPSQPMGKRMPRSDAPRVTASEGLCEGVGKAVGMCVWVWLGGGLGGVYIFHLSTVLASVCCVVISLCDVFLYYYYFRSVFPCFLSFVCLCMC